MKLLDFPKRETKDQTKYTREYRKKMKQKGFVKVEVWVPERYRSGIKMVAGLYRDWFEADNGT